VAKEFFLDFVVRGRDHENDLGSPFTPASANDGSAGRAPQNYYGDRRAIPSEPPSLARLASEKADTSASEHRSHQIALARMMAKKKRGSPSTHIASAIARRIEIHRESP
jgi:hypothetical protein